MGRPPCYCGQRRKGVEGKPRVHLRLDVALHHEALGHDIGDRLLRHRGAVGIATCSAQKLTSALIPAINAGSAALRAGTTYCTSGVMRIAGVSS